MQRLLPCRFLPQCPVHWNLWNYSLHCCCLFRQWFLFFQSVYCCYLLGIYQLQYSLPGIPLLQPVRKSQPEPQLSLLFCQNRYSHFHRMFLVSVVSWVGFFLLHNFLPEADVLHNVRISVFPEPYCHSVRFRHCPPASVCLLNMDVSVVFPL